jgi:hypothetical protein
MLLARCPTTLTLRHALRAPSSGHLCEKKRVEAQHGRRGHDRRLGVAACAAAGIKLDIDLRLIALCCRYSSGAKTPDYDAADAFVALCTAILHAEAHAARPSMATRS